MISYNLEEILSSEIPSNVKEVFKNMLNKQVFYEYNDKCTVGTLVGLHDSKYIIKISNQQKLIPLWKNLQIL